MKQMIISIVGIGLISFVGCASTIDSLSNNSSGDAIRGTKMSAGVDVMSGVPVPSVSMMMGSLARKGKADRSVITVDNQATNIVSENYNIDSKYDTSGKKQLLEEEKRTSTKELGEKSISVDQNSGMNFGIVTGNLFANGGTTRIMIGNNNGNSIITPIPTPVPVK